MDTGTIAWCAMLLVVAATGEWITRRRRSGELAVWRHASTMARGGTVASVEEGFEVERRGTTVHACVVPHIAMPHRQVRISAKARVRPQPRFSIGLPRGGLERVSLGPAKGWTARPTWLASRWTEQAADWWRKAAATRLTGTGNDVELVWDRVVDNPSDLVAGIELVAHFAGDDLGARAALSALPEAHPLSDRLAVRLAPDDLIVEVVHKNGVARTTATLGPFGVPTHRCQTPDALKASRQPWVTSDAVAAFAKSGATELLFSPEAAELTWGHLELDEARLRAGFYLLRAAVAPGSVTPYR